ncbi:hypothetical protein OOZ15_17980 [Galbibacter sp. EGI 63066]|nr:hypothetical protein [Galbibacter sp. EGI 63066]MCX2681849.1 hypothetical protein [Galbibacter sp. EGI 63066]
MGTRSGEKEHFWVAGLDNKNKILFIELVSLGGGQPCYGQPAGDIQNGYL